MTLLAEYCAFVHDDVIAPLYVASIKCMPKLPLDTHMKNPYQLPTLRAMRTLGRCIVDQALRDACAERGRG